MSAMKRKRAVVTKFYAVRRGKTPGIYHDWDDCLNQVKGFSGAVFKSFGTLTEAQDFIQSTTVNGTNNQGSHKWYGVRVGRTPGIYTSWPKVQEQVVGWKAPQFRAFSSRTEAEHFVSGTQEPRHTGGGNTEHDTHANEDEGMRTNGKRAKTSRGGKAIADDAGLTKSAEDCEYLPGEAPLAEGTDDDFDKDIVLDSISGTLRYKDATEQTLCKYEATEHRADAPIKIYTDGSSLGNGTALAVSGVGVYFGPRDPRNISAVIPGSRQTNQRAELSAIMRALEVAPRNRKITIYSDSNYAIKCVSEWFQRWRTNGWTNSAKKPVENRDLIQKIIGLLEDRCRLLGESHLNLTGAAKSDAANTFGDYWARGPTGVKFVWVKGHSQDPGNIAADALAVAAAKEAKELLHTDHE